MQRPVDAQWVNQLVYRLSYLALLPELSLAVIEQLLAIDLGLARLVLQVIDFSLLLVTQLFLRLNKGPESDLPLLEIVFVVVGGADKLKISDGRVVVGRGSLHFLGLFKLLDKRVVDILVLGFEIIYLGLRGVRENAFKVLF